MNYMTGLMLGASIGRYVQRGMRGGIFEPIHVLSGRRRYFHSRLKGNPVLAGEIRRYFAGLQGIVGVEVNPVTGTLLLVHILPEELVDRLLGVLNNKWRRGTEKRSYGAVGQKLRGFFNRTDHTVRRKTNGLLDLKTCAALGLAWRGAQKMIQLGQRPSGPQMLWWAYNLLRRGRI